MGRLDARELAARLARRPRDFALFDIREAGEAEEGHIPDATFLPRREIEIRIEELISGPATRIVLYGGDDGREDLARATLRELGYRDVAILAGGIEAWRAMGFRVATGVNVRSKHFGERVLEEDEVARISVEDFATLQLSDAPFLQWDVRTQAEHERATLPRSLSLPGVEIVGLAEAAAARDVPVVLHCAGRTRSIIAARTLTLLGVDRAVALENGTMGWRLSGRTLVAGTDRPPAAVGRVERAFDLARQTGVPSKSPREVMAALEARRDRNLVVVDIRSRSEHEECRIPGSVPREGGQLLQCADEVLAVEATPVVLVDSGDGRAAVVAYWLRRMGYPDVALLDGGLPAWREAGLPLSTGLATTEPRRVTALRREVPVVEAAELDRARDCLLDVGTSRAFKAGHVPGALWLPRGWIEARADEVLPRGRRVVVIATDEAQAILAAATLRGRGYDAVVLDGGNAGWTTSGGALEKTDRLPLPLPPDVIDPPYLKGEAGMRRYLEWEIALTGH